MAQVTLQIGDRAHTVTCADGGEARVEALGHMLADKLDEALNAPPPTAIADDKTLGALAERLERLADALETDAPSA